MKIIDYLWEGLHVSILKFIFLWLKIKNVIRFSDNQMERFSKLMNSCLNKLNDDYNAQKLSVFVLFNLYVIKGELYKYILDTKILVTFNLQWTGNDT